jgi:hypothetical protein
VLIVASPGTLTSAVPTQPPVDPACFAARLATTACPAQRVSGANHQPAKFRSGSVCGRAKPAHRRLKRRLQARRKEEQACLVGAPRMPARRRQAEQVGTDDTHFGEDVSRTCSNSAASTVMPPAMWRLRYGLLYRVKRLTPVHPTAKWEADPATSGGKTQQKFAERGEFFLGNLSACLS